MTQADRSPGERAPYPYHDVIVIGGGPAGYTAMIYLANEHVDALCVEGFESGGQIAKAAMVRNFPGFPDGVVGAELPQLMRDQAEKLGGAFVFDQVTKIEAGGDGGYVVHGTMESWRARAVVLATGSSPRRLGLEAESALRNRGVAYCALCDGPFFSGKRVAVIGGGDAAVEHTMTLTNLGCKVLVVHRRNEFRAARSGQAFLDQHPDVEIATPYTVDDILASDNGVVAAVRIEHTESGQHRTEPVNAVFVAIGHEPVNDLAFGLVDVHDDGHVATLAGTSRTSRPGFFAAGDLIDPSYHQAVTAAASGCIAAVDASRWLANQHLLGRSSTTRTTSR